ncbi:Protein CBR-SRSX-8 [Caenorhabditis briggsae]|uniref:Protein CBR-SRSX-8 n=1 Tax=Caenorhabditis briggsae TaxID=6238 RepID=A8X2L5_CAEBR|nr:Protein CBR-SRSX-8 [Caenorhabditis briggsae]CAP26875.2 Protein CBR-SRSX-8 [Caenorhabditis briggsae]
MYRWNQILIACHKSFFIVFGLFGNIHLIYIILSTPTFRTKSSLLQCIQSLAHVFCIMSSFLDVYLMITDTGILRETCFHTIFPVVFSYCIQSTIMVFILSDILIIVSFPLIHRNFPTWKYVTAMTLGPIAWGTFIVIWGFQDENYEILRLCSSYTALQRPVRRVLAAVTVASNSISLIIFLILIIVFWKKESPGNIWRASCVRQIQYGELQNHASFESVCSHFHLFKLLQLSFYKYIHNLRLFWRRSEQYSWEYFYIINVFLFAHILYNYLAIKGVSKTIYWIILQVGQHS